MQTITKYFILYITFIVYSINASVSATNTTPQDSAFNIILHSLMLIRDLQIQNKLEVETIKPALLSYFEKNISTYDAAEFAMRDYFYQLSPKDKEALQVYIKNSIINDYANIIALNNKSDLSAVQIETLPDTKYKDNKAIVKMKIKLSQQAQAIDFSVRMVYNSKWLIYDISVSGVSLIKSYRSRFNSQIKRNGLENFLAKIRRING